MRKRLALIRKRRAAPLGGAFSICWSSPLTIGALLSCIAVGVGAAAAESDSKAAEKEPPSWNIESPPGPESTQSIDTDEGTWINLDVSPDGGHIVFDLLGDLYRMPIAGAPGGPHGPSPEKLTSGRAWDMQPRYSPDGKWIAFTSDRSGANKLAGDNLWVLNAKRPGEPPVQVTQESFRLVNGPAWSPDSDYLVGRKHFSSRRSLGAGEMWMYHRSGMAAGATAGAQLTKRPNDQKDVNEPIFSPDGKYLYYSQDATAGSQFEYDKDSNKQIYVVKRLELETGEVETVISGPGGACRPTPSPDGGAIAFVRRVGARTGLHLFDVRSGAVRLLYDKLERDMQEAWAIHGVYPAFAWMPDGQSIVIWAKGKIRRIQIADGAESVIPFRVRDTRKISRALRFPQEVAPQKFDVRMLRWVRTSPDGRQVAYQALGHIYVRGLPDGEPRRLTSQTDHFEFCPSYSRDGRHLVYTTWNDEKLGAVRVASANPDEAESWRVTTAPGHYLDPVFSPDGQTIVYQKSGGGYLTSPLWSREPGLYKIALRNGAAQRIAATGSHPQFGASNDRVFYLDSESTPDADNLRLCSMDLQGHDVRRHYTSQWATDYQLSPDGKWVAFVERFHVYLAPFVQTGTTLSVGPDAKGLPQAKVTREAGDGIHFSGDSRRLHWSLGPQLFTQRLDEAFAFLDAPVKETPVKNTPVEDTPQGVEPPKKKTPREEAPPEKAPPEKAPPEKAPPEKAPPEKAPPEKAPPEKAPPEKAPPEKTAPEAPPLSIGFAARHAAPEGVLALVGGRLITMRGDEVIEDGTVLVDGNRIVAVGRRAAVEIPEGARVVDLQGQFVLPGFVDAHAHGPQAEHGITPQRSWVDLARLAFGVTTIHDPSNDTQSIFAASEMTKAGLIVAPRTFSTGTILYGAAGSYKAEIGSLDDALFHLRRMRAVGAFSVKSYNQPRRDQRQQVIAAGRDLKMMVVPEGGSTLMHNLTMIVDGHTGIEHTLPVQSAYDDVMDLWRGTGVGYTPTLSVAYGGISGEQYWYEIDDLWLHPRLQTFIPPHVLTPRARRRNKSPLEDYNHIRVAEIARQVVDDQGLVQAGGHGQLNGVCTHWEMWSFVQGGMTNLQALRCGTLHGARYLGLDGDIGSLAPGKLADLVVLAPRANPLKEIRHSERVHYVIANGRMFDASRMSELGSPQPPPPLYWERAGEGVSMELPRVLGCGCLRPGCASWQSRP